MAALPEEVKQAWDNRDGAVVLTTTSPKGWPNSIYATCVSLFDDKIIVADNYFAKTRENIQSGGKMASVLFITKEGKAYQIKGTIEYYTTGPVFDNMKSWNPEKHPGHAAAAVCIEMIYSGSEKLL